MQNKVSVNFNLPTEQHHINYTLLLLSQLHASMSLKCAHAMLLCTCMYTHTHTHTHKCICTHTQLVGCANRISMNTIGLCHSTSRLLGYMCRPDFATCTTQVDLFHVRLLFNLSVPLAIYTHIHTHKSDNTSSVYV